MERPFAMECTLCVAPRITCRDGVARKVWGDLPGILSRHSTAADQHHFRRRHVACCQMPPSTTPPCVIIAFATRTRPWDTNLRSHAKRPTPRLPLGLASLCDRSAARQRSKMPPRSLKKAKKTLRVYAFEILTARNVISAPKIPRKLPRMGRWGASLFNPRNPSFLSHPRSQAASSKGLITDSSASLH